MKTCSKCKKSRPIEEFGKHKGRKDGLNPHCKFCTKSYRDKNKEYFREYYQKNKERITDYKRQWKENNKERIFKKRLKYRKNNKKLISERQKIYRQNNKASIRSINAQRRASKLRATPKWLNKEQLNKIKQFYIEAEKLYKKTGIKHHVDHIHPLKGEEFCGLHVPWNLQILTEKENLSKGNKLITEESK